MLSSLALAVELPDSGRLLRESTPPPSLAPPRKPAIETPAEHAPAPLTVSIKLLVTGFTYSGNTAFTTEELNSIMATAVGKEVTLAELEKMVEQITRAYRGKGYFLATAFIPPQSIKPGQPVKVEILEGRLEEINLKTSPPKTRVPHTLLEQYRDRIAVGKPADEARLTEIAMLLNDLPALKSRLVLEPGKEPGGTRATLEVAEGKPYGVSLFTDNHGNNSTGYYRVGADLGLYSPFRLGDRLSIRALSSTSGNTQNMGVNWSVPVSPYGTSIALDYSWLRYELGGSFKSLDAKGDANSFSLMVLQPLIRSGNMSLNTFIAGEGKLLDDRINTVGAINKRHIVDGQAGVNLYSADSLLGGGYNFFNITCTGGGLAFDNFAAKANDQGALGLHTEGGYFKISGAFSRTQTIYGDLVLFAGFSGQWSNKNLDSAEKLSIGGPFAVRAYPVGEASADQGMITTVELRYPLPKLEALPGRVQLAGLFDQGSAVIDADPIAGSFRNVRHLYGSGFGVNWQWDELVSLRSSVSWRLGELPTSDNTGGDKPTFYYQVIVRY